jgi:hypothetical protein
MTRNGPSASGLGKVLTTLCHKKLGITLFSMEKEIKIINWEQDFL